MWYQPELFDLDDPETFKWPKKRIKVNYEALYELLKKTPLTFSQIKEITGVSHSGVAQVITTLSLKYPIYELERGVYKLYGEDDYGEGINRKNLKL